MAPYLAYLTLQQALPATATNGEGNVQAHQTYTEWTDGLSNGGFFFGVEDLIDGGRAALAQFVSSFQNAALPPGAVVEIEVVVRQRAAAPL